MQQAAPQPRAHLQAADFGVHQGGRQPVHKACCQRLDAAACLQLVKEGGASIRARL
jgi:hypothetical protein